MSNLLPPRVVVTSHSEDGTSIFSSDSRIQTVYPFGPAGTSFATFHSRPVVPVSNTTSPISAPPLPRPDPSGVNFCIADYPPNFEAPYMHRTLTLDYAVVISGEIVLKLDGGDEKTVKAGEYIVQRGVNHLWANRGDVPCRVMFVMIGAEKIILGDGIVLEETVFKKP